MNGKLKVTASIKCDWCSCKMKRVKTIRVIADNKEDAKKEAEGKISAWRKTLAGEKCSICKSIIKGVNLA